MKVKLIDVTPGAIGMCAGAMSKCYDQKVSSASVVKYGVQSGHLSVLEHAHATFDIECSLAVLGQLTRHRHLSFTVMSTRGAEPKCGVEVPIQVRNDPEMYKMYMDAIEDVLKSYGEMVAKGVDIEAAAYLLPKGTRTKLRVTGSLRAWLEYLPKRLCKRAMNEHREMAACILAELEYMLPDVFENVKAPCKTCNETRCSF